MIVYSVMYCRNPPFGCNTNKRSFIRSNTYKWQIFETVFDLLVLLRGAGGGVCALLLAQKVRYLGHRFVVVVHRGLAAARHEAGLLRQSSLRRGGRGVDRGSSRRVAAQTLTDTAALRQAGRHVSHRRTGAQHADQLVRRILGEFVSVHSQSSRQPVDLFLVDLRRQSTHQSIN